MKVMPDLGEYLFGGSRGSKIGMVVKCLTPQDFLLPFMCMKNTLNNLYNPTTPYLKVKFYCQNFVSLQIRYHTKEHTFAKEGII